MGTALAAAALFLLARLGVSTPISETAIYLLLLGLGLGLGMVMQVLVLAAQNAVDYRLLGVATSGSSLARQIGGSIGVSVFGAIFTNRLGDELARRLPPGVHAPTHGSPALVQQLPPAIHAAYVAAYSAALHPVFLTAATVMLVAFGLSWLLRDVPLRETAGSAAIEEGRAVSPTVRAARPAPPPRSARAATARTPRRRAPAAWQRKARR